MYEVKNEQGQSESFYMEVKTVVCGDALCDIDMVRIYWDLLGFYDRIELPSDVELEKAEGKPFDQNDYKKLDQILADKDNSLLVSEQNATFYF